MSDKLYSIGELSEITGINDKTLRYYDSIGLLTPGYKNPDTRYRYYEKDQVFNVYLIKKLQSFGFSLNEIKEMLQLNTPAAYAEEVGKKAKLLRAKIDEMERVYAEATLFMEKLTAGAGSSPLRLFDEQDAEAHRIRDMVKNHEVRMEHINACSVIYTQKHMKDYNNAEISVNRWFELFKAAKKQGLSVCGSVILTYHVEHPMDQFFRSTCDLEAMLPVAGETEKMKNIKTYGGFDAAVVVHIGDYSTISATHLKLLRWIEAHGKTLAGNISEEYLISPVDIQLRHEYLTRIIAPVS